ncbi:phosphate/phosphite/phosphonate ABC transporter substrate-binding protein [Denitromonas sp.]|uniref:phosphate/phosphite/phosphonate ABC transporter substrate-binding protein n=1 Tax=Denitromonas sp. TaxID=2734609 RepID=UPI003A84EF01
MRFFTFFSTIFLILICGTPPGAEIPPASIRAGVASMITPVSAVKYYQQIVDYLGAKLEVPAEMVHRTTYDEIDSLLEEGQVDVAFICSAPYVIDHKQFGVELLVAPQIKGRPFYHSNIIVHRDSDIKTVEELQGKAFVFVDPKSNTGRLYPAYYLAKAHETPESFFGSTLYSYSHNKSIEMIAKKKVDGAAVDSIVYDFMLTTHSPYAQETKIIHRSPQFGIPPVVVPSGLSPFLKNAMREVFLTMHTDSAGKRILDAMKIDKFIEVPDSNYDSIRAMEAFMTNSEQQLAGQSSARLKNPELQSDTIYFGILPRDNPRISYEKYQPLADYLSIQTGKKFELKLETSYKDVVNSLGQGRTAFALLGPLTYLEAFKRYGAMPIARSKTARGEVVFRSVIVTSQESSIQELSQLTGKKFAFSAPWSTSGNLLPRCMLAWSGIHLSSLAGYANFNYHDTVARKIISHEFDAGAIRSSTAEQYLQYGLRIIATSEPIPTGPVVTVNLFSATS